MENANLSFSHEIKNSLCGVYLKCCRKLFVTMLDGITLSKKSRSTKGKNGSTPTDSLSEYELKTSGHQLLRLSAISLHALFVANAFRIKHHWIRPVEQ